MKACVGNVLCVCRPGSPHAHARAHAHVVDMRERERDGLVINDLPTVESKAPSHFGGVLLASARHAPLAPDKGYNTHDTLSGVHRSLGAF